MHGLVSVFLLKVTIGLRAQAPLLSVLDSNSQSPQLFSSEGLCLLKAWGRLTQHSGCFSFGITCHLNLFQTSYFWKNL